MAVRSLKNSTLENFSNYSSSMNAGYDFNDFELIESVFLASNTANVTFDNLQNFATEYKHLQIRYVARSTVTASLADNVAIRFNNDGGNNYSYHYLLGESNPVITSFGAASLSYAFIASMLPSSQHNSGVFGNGVIDIVDAFSGSKNKTVRALAGFMGTAGTNYSRLILSSNAWFSQSPIFKIELSNSLLLSPGSRFSLYGVR
jgi:hypothetical protein